MSKLIVFDAETIELFCGNCRFFRKHGITDSATKSVLALSEGLSYRKRKRQIKSFTESLFHIYTTLKGGMRTTF